MRAFFAYVIPVPFGDLTGDGRADLPARKASTGDVDLFADDGASRLKPGVRIRSWATYKKIVGAYEDRDRPAGLQGRFPEGHFSAKL
ncbi:hypothetical protein [Streptomyces sp. SID13726]|uniref:hypothetical protein n=1 Tax=Streptomyces sp. SID13726 TaxID=2706058 RepID=UPI0013B60978|nr:hypothetical protein [Streptomyces sp. SID13726]NEB05326.1 hypothetical protein [Streptomyces sp. SID13726]